MFYLLPVVLVVASLAYVFWMKKKVANMSPQEMAESYHQHNSQYFEMEPEEKVVGFWSGVEFQQKESGLKAAAGAAAGLAVEAVSGISSYTPQVHVARTSSGRLLVAREYSEMLQRGNFKQILALPQGTATTSSTSLSGAPIGKAPANPFNPIAKLEFAQLVGANGESYEAWLCPQGTRVGEAGFHSILAPQAA